MYTSLSLSIYIYIYNVHIQRISRLLRVFKLITGLNVLRLLLDTMLASVMTVMWCPYALCISISIHISISISISIDIDWYILIFVLVSMGTRCGVVFVFSLAIFALMFVQLVADARISGNIDCGEVCTQRLVEM